MKLSHIVNLESNTEDSGDHEYRGDFQSTQPEDITDDINTPAEAQENLTELESEDREIETADDAIDQASDAIEQIDETVQVIKAQDEAGVPISDMQVQTLEVTHESIMRHLGLSSQAFPTTESLKQGSRGKQLMATLESEGSSILTKLSNLIGQTVQQVIDFVQRLLRNSWALGKYASYLRKKVSALDYSAKPKQEEMEASKFAIAVDGKADYSCVVALSISATVLMNSAMKAADKLSQSNFATDGVDPEVFVADFISDKDIPISGDREITSNGFDVFKTFQLYKVTGTGEPAADKSKVLSVREIDNAIDAAEKIIKAIKAFDKVDSKIKRFAGNVKQFLAHTTNAAAGLVSGAAKEKAKQIGQIRWMRLVMSKIVGKYPLEAFKIAKVLLDYARHSLKQYEGGSDVKDQIPETK